MIEIPIIQDAFDIYSRHYSSLGDYSATTIIDSPRRVALFKRHGEGIKYTPESQAASLVGTAVHDKMESLLKMANVKHPSYLVERSVAHPVTVGRPDETTEGGILIPKRKTWTRLLGGKFDILADNKHLTDIKTCKTWKVIFDPHKEDWTKQLNVYRWLLHHRGIEVETLTVLAFFLDWVENQKLRNRDYPEEPIVAYKIDLWPLEEADHFIKTRMLMHCEAEDLDDPDLPRCTEKEMWENAPEFAIFKNETAKRAVKVCKDTDLHGAIEVAMSLKGIGKESYIEIRYQSRKRCEKYCAVNEHCNQYQEYVKGGGLQVRKEKFYLGGVL